MSTVFKGGRNATGFPALHNDIAQGGTSLKELSLAFIWMMGLKITHEKMNEF